MEAEKTSTYIYRIILISFTYTVPKYCENVILVSFNIIVVLINNEFKTIKGSKLKKENLKARINDV